MNTENMSCFLEQVSRSHSNDFIVMVMTRTTSGGGRLHQNAADFIGIPMGLFSPFPSQLLSPDHTWPSIGEFHHPANRPARICHDRPFRLCQFRENDAPVPSSPGTGA